MLRDSSSGDKTGWPKVTDELGPEQLRAILQDAHLNFLIGAGTSSAFFGLLGGIEDALTEIASEPDADENAKRLARASIQAMFFDGVIAPNIALLELDADAGPVLRSYGEFGRVLNRLLINRRNSILSKKVNLFTTNVDLVFEVAFERLGATLIDGFMGRIRPVYDLGVFGSLHYLTGVRYEHRSEAPTFDLYKLHGSVGWQLTDDRAAPAGIAFDHELRDVHAIAEALNEIRESLVPVDAGPTIDVEALLAGAAGQELPGGLDAFEDAYRRLPIINPEKQKFETTVLTETYYELIRRFANELERENSVLFVHGFSFRDEHLRKLVVRSMRANPTLQVVVFCFVAGDRDAYAALVPDEQLPNGNLTYIAPTGDDKLDLDEVVRLYFQPMAGPASTESDAHIDALLPKGEGDPVD